MKVNRDKTRELYKKSIITAFNDNYQNADSVDKAVLHNLLLKDEVIVFYYQVGLLFMNNYLDEITRK